MVSPLHIDHVTAIVPDAAAVARVLETVTGAAPAATHDVAGMRIVTFRLGDVELHVNQPTRSGPVADALAKAGTHLHHVALTVDDLDATLARLSAAGIEAQGPVVETAPGLREVFLSPVAMAGLFVQLVERRAGDGALVLDDGAVDALVGGASEEEVRRR